MLKNRAGLLSPPTPRYSVSAIVLLVACSLVLKYVAAGIVVFFCGSIYATVARNSRDRFYQQ